MWNIVGHDRPLFSEWEDSDTEDALPKDPHEQHWEDPTLAENMDLERDAGAIYSGFQGSTKALFDIGEFTKAVSFISADDAVLTDPLIDQTTEDCIREAIDEHNPPEENKHRQRIYDEGLFNTRRYFISVMTLARRDDLGELFKLTDDDFIRYQWRVRRKWKGVDSLHDALMLREGKQRPAFDMDGFLKLYPDWIEIRDK